MLCYVMLCYVMLFAPEVMGFEYGRVCPDDLSPVGVSFELQALLFRSKELHTTHNVVVTVHNVVMT